MNEFLLEHADFARWAFCFLLLGSALAVAWSASFRRLARAGTDHRELVWEAYRGLAGAAAWFVSLALIFLMMVSTADINGFAAIAASSSVSDLLVESIGHTRSLAVAPAAGSLAFVVVFSGGLAFWSGAWRVLRSGEATS